jgi:hypothetical protein
MMFIDVNINTVSLDWTRDYYQRVAGLRLSPGANKRKLIAITPEDSVDAGNSCIDVNNPATTP